MSLGSICHVSILRNGHVAVSNLGVKTPIESVAVEIRGRDTDLKRGVIIKSWIVPDSADL